MKDIIKKLLREAIDTSESGNINESATKKEVIDFILDFNYLLSLNLAMVKNQAKDEKSKLALIQMQQKFKTPVINGKTFFELADERITPRKDLFNPRFLSAYLTQIRNYLVYVKEHINRFVVDGIYKTGWLDRISKLEATYKNIIGTNLQENTQRIRHIMRLNNNKNYEQQPIVLVGTAGSGKSTTAKALSKKLGISYIDVDERQGSIEYENLCKNKPGVEVEITRTPDGRNYGKTNHIYKRCVISKLLEKYGNSKVILDIGAGTQESSDILENLPNLFVFGLPSTPEEDAPYIQFLKQSRVDRAKKMGQPELEKDTKDEHIQLSIDSIREFYKGKQNINPFYEDGKRKTTQELVDEVIFKLT
jgi:adenylate kinase family enzyme